MKYIQLSILSLTAILAAVPDSADAADDRLMPMRNHNPFLQVYGLPAFQSAVLTQDGKTDSRVNFDIGNHADSSSEAGESATLDGESYYLTYSLRHGLSDKIELGFDLPVVSHAEGILDPFIEQWHDWFGLTNGNRMGPSNKLKLQYDGPSGAGFNLDSSATGIGDIQLSAAMKLFSESLDGDTRLTLRSSVKLPTGDEEKLLGSGAVDISFALHATNSSFFSNDKLAASAFAGVLLLGDGDVLSEIQNDTVGFGGLSTSWQMTQKLSITGQLYAQGEYYDSELKEIGGSSVQFAVGGAYQFNNERMSLSFGIIEDLFSDATTDVAFHFGLHIRGL